MATKKEVKVDGRKNPASKGKRHDGSMSDQIDKLKIGQSVAVAQRFLMGEMLDPEFEIKDALHKHRSNLAAYVVRVKADELDTRNFRVEGGTYLTDDKTAIIVSVTCTRVE